MEVTIECEDEEPISFESLAKRLDANKVEFLDQLEREIKTYIVGTGIQCIAIDEITESDSIHRQAHHAHPVEFNATYVEVLIQFVRKKPHNGHELDSALTAPVLRIIEENYIALYERNSAVISEGFLKILNENKAHLRSFMERLVEKILDQSDESAKVDLVNALVSQLHRSSESETAQQIGDIASTTIGTQIASGVGNVLLRAIASNTGSVVANFLTGEAFKTIISVLIQRLILGIITTTVFKFLVAQIGALGASAIMWILIPIVIAFLIRQIYTFPDRIGREVSSSVRANLEKNFEGMNANIMKQVFDEVIHGDKLLESVAEDEALNTMIKMLKQDSIE
jgi:hypothetical protein